MRKLLAFVCVCALAWGLSGCTKEEPYAPQYNGESVPVEINNVAASKKITDGGFLDMLERLRGGAYRPLRKSYVFSRQQVYRGHWTRVVYSAHPKFINEIKGPGARKIKRYYKERYENCADAEDFPWLDTYKEIADSADEMMRYRLQVYAADVLADYVAVTFFRQDSTDGRGVLSAYTADVFDRATGTKQALGDVVDLKGGAEAINQAVKETLRVRDIRPFAPYDVRKAKNQAFTVTEDGPVLLFAPGELAPEAYGAIQIALRWDALEE